jgi:hypothetical protein
MSQRSPSLPLVLIAAFVLLVAMLVSGILPSPVVVAFDCSDPAAYGLTYDDCKRTEQALGASPRPTNTTGSDGGGQAPTSTGTSTATDTVGPTQTNGAQVTSTPAPTLTPTAARQAPAEVATATATSALPPGLEARLCLPGAVVSLVGEATPGTALLAYFDERPVGGGFSRGDGRFSIDLLIGEERPGVYLVEVRERVGDAPVASFGCEVPTLTPTPTVDLVP